MDELERIAHELAEAAANDVMVWRGHISDFEALIASALLSERSRCAAYIETMPGYAGPRECAAALRKWSKGET